jgi:hypothetical protein
MPRDVFTPETIGPELIATDKRIRQAAIRGLRLAARFGRGRVVRAIRDVRPFPVVDTGELLRSPKVTRLDNGAILEVTAPHAAYLEFGTGPAGKFPGPAFTPPLEALKAWGRRKKRRAAAKRKGKGGRPNTAKKRDSGRDLSGSPEQREGPKRKRAGAKGKRVSATDKAGDAFGAAVWANMRKKGMRGKRYYELASAFFGDDVEKFVGRAVAKVSR